MHFCRPLAQTLTVPVFACTAGRECFLLVPPRRNDRETIFGFPGIQGMSASAYGCCCGFESSLYCGSEQDIGGCGCGDTSRKCRGAGAAGDLTEVGRCRCLWLSPVAVGVDVCHAIVSAADLEEVLKCIGEVKELRRDSWYGSSGPWRSVRHIVTGKCPGCASS